MVLYFYVFLSSMKGRIASEYVRSNVVTMYVQRVGLYEAKRFQEVSKPYGLLHTMHVFHPVAYKCDANMVT